MTQFERVAVRLGAFVGESDQIRWQASDDVEYGAVARSLLAKLFRGPRHLRVQSRNRQWRFLQGEAFDGFLELGRHHAALTTIRAFLADQRLQPDPAILRNQTLRCSYMESQRRGLPMLAARVTA